MYYAKKINSGRYEIYKSNGTTDYDGIKAREEKLINTLYESGSRDYLGNFYPYYGNKSLEDRVNDTLKSYDRL